MAQSYFVWQGMDSRAMGVIVRHAAPLIRPEERIEHMMIPGLSGDLTTLQGTDIYNSYIQTVEISVRGAWRVREVFDWLRGSGKVTFSSDPDKQQDARVIGAVTLERVSRNLDSWAGSVQFYCQPLKEALVPKTVVFTESGTLTVEGDVQTLPRFVLTTSSANVTLAVNGKAFTISEASGTIVVDSYIREAVSGNGTTLLTGSTAGEFPVLDPGDNTISGAGWSRLEVNPRERWL